MIKPVQPPEVVKSKTVVKPVVAKPVPVPPPVKAVKGDQVDELF